MNEIKATCSQELPIGILILIGTARRLPVTATPGVAVLLRGINIDSNQTSCINEFNYWRREQVIE